VGNGATDSRDWKAQECCTLAHFTILGRLPAVKAGYSHITKLYVDRYGAPPPGTRVFIRTRQMSNGWVDFPTQTTAVVPKS
jgi:hypothetical protein